jgi:hypothetical protein
MGLPEDLKNYRAEDSFQLIEPETAAAILFWALFGCIVLDKFGVFTR